MRLTTLVLTLSLLGCNSTPNHINLPPVENVVPSIELELVSNDKNATEEQVKRRKYCATYYFNRFLEDWLKGRTTVVRKVRVILLSGLNTYICGGAASACNTAGPPVAEILVPASWDDTCPGLPHDLFHAFADAFDPPLYSTFVGDRDPFHRNPIWGCCAGVRRESPVGKWWESVLLGDDPWKDDR